MPVVADRIGTPQAEELHAHQPWIRRALALAGWCVLLVAPTIVLHELGHLAAARWLGFPEPALHFSSVSYGSTSALPAGSEGIVGLAGPAVSVLLALGACGWIAWKGPARWAFALAVAAASRFAVGVPYTLANLVVRAGGGRLQPPAFDEHRAATALGWSGDAVLGSMTVFLLAVLLWLTGRLPGGQRSAAWAGLLLGTALGWALWMNALGPVLLP